MERSVVRGLAAALVVLGGAFVPTHVEAQKRGGVPPGHMPPPGACRVWYDGVPPGHQPPPTSCSAATREAYRTGGRVIYGSDRGRDGWRGGRADRSRDWRDCSEKDRRKGRCDDYRARYPDARYPSERNPEGYPNRSPDRGDVPTIDDILGGVLRRRP